MSGSFVPLAAHSSQDPQPNASCQSDGARSGADFERGQAPAALAITTITAAVNPAKGNCLIRAQAQVTHVEHPHNAAIRAVAEVSLFAACGPVCRDERPHVRRSALVSDASWLPVD